MNKKPSSSVSNFSDEEEHFEFLDEMSDDGFGGCELSEILMDMLKNTILNQNPFNVSLSDQNEDRILKLFGYDLREFAVKEKNGRIEHYEGAIKHNEAVPKGVISSKEFTKYIKKSVLDRESQELMVKVIGWLISKFNNNDLDKS